MPCIPCSPVRNWWNLRADPRHTHPGRKAGRHRAVPRLLAFGALGLLCLLAACPTRAENWRAQLREEGLPPSLVGVDKARQTFMFFEKKSPLRLKYVYPCTTGQLRGDKQVLNDLRTPEGVYFVEYKIASGLDFKEYGGIAYTLNYPNPVDRLRGKTGHGIWIHSKGFGIEPLSTRGCVAIGLKDIAEVGPSLTPGTAVVLAEHLDEKKQAGQDKDGTARELRQLMQRWSAAWAARSPRLFDFYDQASYSRAMPETFAAFRQNKERLFKMLRFIKIYNRKIHVLEGPGYWVTWSEQLYTASNLSTEGVRRLYWQRSPDKKFRIVGMEWTPRNLGMQAAYQKGQLVAEAPQQTVSDASSEAPRLPRLDMPETPGRPQKDIPGQQVALTDPLVPRRMPAAETPAEVQWGQPEESAALPERRPEQRPEAQAPAPAVPAPAAVQASQPATPPAPGPSPSAPAPQPGPRDLDALRAAAEAWEAAFAARSPDLASLYDSARYNREPGTPRGPSLAATLRETEHRFRRGWTRRVSRKPVVEFQGQLGVSRSEQMLITPQGAQQSQLTLWWRRGEDGAYRVVASQSRPAELGLTADYLAQVSAGISAAVEEWRTAWEAGQLDAYMAFYAPDAIQQGRRGATAIRRQKEALWQRTRPASVRLVGLRIQMDRQDIRVDMDQAYTDSAGHSDRGVKTLWLRQDGTAWRIVREDWTPPRAKAVAPR